MEVRVTSAPLVNVRVTSNVNSFTAEKRFDRSLTIADLKGRLELVTGGSAQNMTLTVYDQNDVKVGELNNDEALFGSYCVEENYRIHVLDTTRRLGEFDDTSNVEKYELSEEEYNKKDDSVRNFLLKNKLGKYNEEEMKKREEEKAKQQKEEEEKANTIKTGSRCQVRVPGEPTRLGCVAYVGRVQFKPGIWVGVQYDEPLGKNNGSVAGVKYFECSPKYGGFTRPAYCEVGDFPPIDAEEEEPDEL